MHTSTTAHVPPLALAGATASRLIFAHQLRGVAAMLIVITHFFGNYFGSQAGLAGLTFSPDLHMVAPPWVHWFDFPYFKGPFGVAVFFLISGFVIPFSLEKATPLRFLLMRAFRIFPTYMAAFVLTLLVLAFSAYYWGLPFSHPPLTLLTNVLLVNNLFGIPSIDPINWTLSIEIKFYLTAALLGGYLLRPSFVYMAGFLCTLLAATALLAQHSAPPALWVALATEWNYLMFMLIGVPFYQHITGLIGLPALVGRSLLMLAAFSWNWTMGPERGMFAIINVYYYYAFVVFALAYFARSLFRPVKLLDFFADISYPLYVVHSLIGFAALKLLMHAGMPFGVAVVLVLALVTGLAYLLHRHVETASNALGKRLARQPAAGAQQRLAAAARPR